MNAIHATAGTNDTFAMHDSAAEPELLRGIVYGLVFVMPFWLTVIAIVSTH